MKGLWVAAALSITALSGAALAAGGGEDPPPRPFTGKNATLPGKVPASLKSVAGEWGYRYHLEDAHLSSGYNGHVFFVGELFLREDGTYEYHYNARWNVEPGIFPLFPVIASLPAGVLIPGFSSSHMDAVFVTETGTYALSDEILLLQPDNTEQTEMDDATMKKPKALKNENRAFLVRVDQKSLRIAGRCARFQIDPVCKKAKDVAYQLTHDLGPRQVNLGAP